MKEKQNEKNKKQDIKSMKMSDKGLEFLKKVEGSVIVNGKHVIYDDDDGLPLKNGEQRNGYPTIGYGHLIKKDEDFSDGLTEKEATELFVKDLQGTYNIIEKQINTECLLLMSQNEYDALVSFVFNIGAGDAKPENKNRGLYQSTAKKYLNDPSHKNQTYPNLESAWKAFRNKGQLDNRRDAEWRLFQNADYSGYK